MNRRGTPENLARWNRERAEAATERFRASAHPSLREIAWAAGFIEGEGSFGSRRAAVFACQLQREPLERLKQYFGGTIGLKKTPLGKPCPYWHVSGARARGVMMTLFAFMSPRRKEQIRKSLGGPSVQDADVQSVEPVPGEPSDG